ncbi:hypothetical protein HH310_15500 [Actinoplanes sp. TBRC 11911]|uniref:hypothetical protein n=1 Tax=Actinoplanes sp. TBRC 11911 TaxID=2729386 RepID=UPI00145FA570|nr:hypothetical protein [Actinoplanes sp. TBRC 11911]NMO52594.1 hypothetical protein [Actinoplanes sp. TBRC 11911]
MGDTSFYGQHKDPAGIGRVEGVKYRVGCVARADRLAEGRIGLTGARSAVNHDGGRFVPAEEVDGDPRGARAFQPGTGSSP